MELWIIAAIIGLAFFAVTNITDKIFRERYFKSTQGYIIVFVGKNVIFLALLPFVDLSAFSPFDYLLLALSAIMLIATVYPYITALSFEEVSRVVPVWNLAPVFVLILSTILLNDRLALNDYAAFSLLLIGGIVISMHFEDIKNVKLSPAFWLMLGSCVAFSINIIILKELYTTHDFWSVFIVGSCMGGLGGISLLALKQPRKDAIDSIKAFKIKGTVLFLTSSIVLYAGALLYNYAIKNGTTSIVAALDGFQSLFLFAYAIILAAIYPGIIKEEISRKAIATKVMGLILMFIGLFLLHLS